MTRRNNSTTPAVVQSVARALSALDALASQPDGMTPKGVAAALGLHLSTTYHLLNTLVASGYAVRCQECRLFRIGPRVSVLYGSYLQGVRPSAAAIAFARALQQATGETTCLCRLVGGDAIHTEVVAGTGATHVAGRLVGMPSPAHLVATGRALLAWLPETRLDAYIMGVGGGTLVGQPWTRDRDAVRVELARVREAGYALDQGDISREICCVAAPIASPAGLADEAIAVVVRRERFVRDLPALISAVVAIAHGASHVGRATQSDSVDCVDPTARENVGVGVTIEASRREFLDAVYPGAVVSG